MSEILIFPAKSKRGGARPGAGRPGHKPTAAARARVTRMAAAGATAAEIGAVFGIVDETLAKHYRTELDLGRAKAAVAKAHGSHRHVHPFWSPGDPPPSAEDVASQLLMLAKRTSDPALRHRFTAAARIILR